LNYAKRINRPSFKNLNPYTLQIDDFILIQGNADLKPEVMHRIESGIQLKNNIYLDLFYSYTKDKIAQFTETKDNSMLIYQFRNFSKSREWGSNLFVPWKLTAWWSG
jgi:iron complex outermembrane receptor protein